MAPRHEIVNLIRQKQIIPDLHDDQPHLDPFESAFAYNNEVFNSQVPTLFVLDDELEDDDTYSYTEQELDETESTDSDSQTQTEEEPQQAEQSFQLGLLPDLPSSFEAAQPLINTSDLQLDLSFLFEPALATASDTEPFSLCFTLQYDHILSAFLTTRFDLRALLFTYLLPPSTALPSSCVFSAAFPSAIEYSPQPQPQLEFPSFCVAMDDAGPHLVPDASSFPEPDPSGNSLPVERDSSFQMREQQHESSSATSTAPAAANFLPVGAVPHLATAPSTSSSETLASSSLPSLVPLDESGLVPAGEHSTSRSASGATGAMGASADSFGGGGGRSGSSGDGAGSGAGSAGAAGGGELALPRTVTHLVNPRNGAQVYIVGTAHFSSESQEDVRKTIAALLPQTVLLELCPSRAGLLTLNEEELMRVAAALDTRRSLELIRRKGVVHGVFEVMMLSLSAHITRQIGMAPGGEFRAAYQQVCAMGQERCRLVLGDRAVGLTLRRAFSSLTLWQKCRLFFALLMAKEPITKEDVEKMKERDLLEGILRELGDSFPQLHRVLVEERDAVLAYNIWRASLQPISRPPPEVITSGASHRLLPAPAATSVSTTGLLETPHPSATSPASLSAASSAGNFDAGAQQPHAHFSACALTSRGGSGGAAAGSGDHVDADGSGERPTGPAERNQQLHISVGSQPYLVAEQKHANATAGIAHSEQMIAGSSRLATAGADEVDVLQRPEEPCGHLHEKEQQSEAESDAEDDMAEVEVSPAADGDDEEAVGDSTRRLTAERPERDRPPVLVAVVGMGHVSGIVAHWDRMPYSIADYLKVPGAELQARRSTMRRALRWAVPFAVLAVGVAIAAGFVSLRRIPGI